MHRLRIALLNASEDDDTPRNFRRELDADLVEFDVHETVPESFEFDAAVVTGSRASVYWEAPWIERTEEWCREAVATGLPMLGICFGHQLLADALGGTVEEMGEYEIGYREVSHDDSRLFAGIENDLTAFTTHSDTVSELPPEADRLAENEYGIHAFRVEHVFGVQFHPEYDPETATRVTAGKDLPDERIQGVLDGITRKNYAAACNSKALFGNFEGYVHELRERENTTVGVSADPEPDCEVTADD